MCAGDEPASGEARHRVAPRFDVHQWISTAARKSGRGLAQHPGASLPLTLPHKAFAERVWQRPRDERAPRVDEPSEDTPLTPMAAVPIAAHLRARLGKAGEGSGREAFPALAPARALGRL
jgi:hypothetical protein